MEVQTVCWEHADLTDGNKHDKKIITKLQQLSLGQLKINRKGVVCITPERGCRDKYKILAGEHDEIIPAVIKEGYTGFTIYVFRGAPAPSGRLAIRWRGRD